MQISPEVVVVLDSDNDDVFTSTGKQQLIIISSDSEEEIVLSDSESGSPSMLSPRVRTTITLRTEGNEVMKSSPSSQNMEKVKGVQHLEQRNSSASNSLLSLQKNSLNGPNTNLPVVCSKHTDKQYHSNSPRPENRSLVQIQRKLISRITPSRDGQFVPLDDLINNGKMLNPQKQSSTTSQHSDSHDVAENSDSMQSPPCKKMKPTTSDISKNTTLSSSPAIESAHQFPDVTIETLNILDHHQNTMLDVQSTRRVVRKRRLLKPSFHPSSSQEGLNISPSSNSTSTQATSSYHCLESVVVKTEARTPQKEDTAFIPTNFLTEQKNNSFSNIPGAFHQLRSLSDSILPVKEEPKSPVRCVHASESDVPRRKRKLCKSMDLDSEAHDIAGPLKTSSSEKSPLFQIDWDFVTSHTQDNSLLRLSFISQLQTEGYSLPHQMISELLQEMITTEVTSTSNAICKILWSDSECFPHFTDRKLLDDLFTTVVDSLMSDKYNCVKNINMALQYFMNILCVNWRNTTNVSDSYVATFLEAKVRQLFSELRRYYNKPVEVFCPHVASTLQQLTCLSLAVIHEPHKLSNFCQQVHDDVFVGLTRDKQKVFLNNLPSPYLVARLSAILLAEEYSPVESRELLWLSHHDVISTDWVSKFLMVCTPYCHDGSIGLSHLLWLLTKLLTNHLQYQHGMILSSPVIVYHPEALIELFDLHHSNHVLEDFMNRLVSDEVLYSTCLFTPEVTHYLKLISTLLEDKVNRIS